ncbi:MAG: hydroxyacid dehydrogenase [Clostridia bacterium]|nr:hydroxyacid dehydrogenase [Clostridia bacterium]
MKKALFLCDDPGNIRKVYGEKGIAALAASYDFLSPGPVSGRELLASGGKYRGAEIVFSTWGMPALSSGEIADALPRLEAVFYGAGSVQAFARPFLERGIRVFSAWAANAVPVAEYALSAILLAGKGFFSCLPLKEDRAAASAAFRTFRGNYGEKVGLLGLGMVGKEVAKLLKPYRLEVLYYDPFFDRSREEEFGVTPASLEEIFSDCAVISNHIANLPATVGMLDYALFSRMRPNAFFLNTGRGAQVVEADLVRALTEVPTRTALLDVTMPEPPEPGHPFYRMKNVFLTPHIAGSAGDECLRMGEYMISEADSFVRGEPLKWEVSVKMLETMA